MSLFPYREQEKMGLLCYETLKRVASPLFLFLGSPKAYSLTSSNPTLIKFFPNPAE